MATRLFSAAALVGMAVVSAPSRAGAQPTVGFAYVSPMAVTNIGIRSAAFSAGGGAERWIGGRISVGGELGILSFASAERRSACCVESADSASTVLFSANAFRHFGGSGR